jgi:endonuclease/exonuclease/phosphatase family metal-dependent hydrolase
MSEIRLVSINIERSKHLDRVATFVTQQQPDVLCVQELVESNMQHIADFYGSKSHHFAPMIKHMEAEVGIPIVGVGIFSRLHTIREESIYYVGSHDAIPDHYQTDENRGNAMNCALVLSEIEKEGQLFRIGTTHFTWSPRGEALALQRNSMASLLNILDTEKEFILCGDFNAPRVYEGKSGEIFGMLATRYKDNIPAHYETSIDASLHRNGKTNPRDFDDKMVDGLFTTPQYDASDVQLHFGVSDHAAVSALIRHI